MAVYVVKSFCRVCLTTYSRLRTTISHCCELEDADSSPNRLAHLFIRTDIDQFSQELRLTSDVPLSGPWLIGEAQWIAGVFYSQDRIANVEDFDVTDALNTVGRTEYVQHTRTAAAFAHIDWAIADHWTVTSGLRATWEKRRFNGGSTDTNPNDGSFLLPSGTSGPVRLTHAVDSLSNTDLSGKLGINFAPNQDWRFYSSFSKRFKSGGFRGSFTFTARELEPFDHEEVYSFEAGFKVKLLDRTLRIHAAAFYYIYDNMQLAASRLGPGSGLSVQVIENVDRAETAGGELDLWWRARPALDFKLGVGLLYTRLGSFVADDATGENLKGKRLANAPTATLNGEARYEAELPFRFGGQALLIVGLFDFSYRSRVFFDVSNSGLEADSSYGLLNGRLEVATRDKNWNIAVWVRNLGDKRYFVEVFGQKSIAGSVARINGMPRTYGATMTIRWP